MRFRCVLALGLLSCAGQAEGSVTLVTGPEEGVLTRAPEVKTLIVEAVAEDRSATELARVSLPADSLDLGLLTKDDARAFRVRGEDTNGQVRVAGESLPVRYGALEGGSLPLYVQRVGETARFPSPFPNAFPVSTLSLVATRYVMGTDGTRGALYDLAALSPVADRVLPVAPRSVVAQGTRLLLVSDAAQATVLDLSSSEQTTLDAPAGGTFAEVAGGATVISPEGEAYVVGATRKDGETSRVLRVTSDLVLSFVELAHARRGAGAAWADGRGLVVAGGSATAPGLEVVGSGATKGAALAFPPIGPEGLAVAPFDGSKVLVSGGSPALRTGDLSCGTACSFVSIDAPAGLALSAASAVRIAGRVLTGGTDRDGMARLFVVDGAGARELATKEKRGAISLLSLPTGNVAIVGGGAASLESFRP